MLHTLAVTGVLAYIVASVLFVYAAIKPKRLLTRIAYFCLLLGFVAQTVLLVPAVNENSPLYVEGGGDLFFWISWALTLAHLLLALRMPMPIVGAFAAPAAALFLTSSSLLAHMRGAHTPGLPHWFLFSVHVLPILIAEFCLVASFVASAVFLVQDRRLKSKAAAGELLRGPSLKSLDNWNYRLVFTGFVCMTVAVISGAAWAFDSGKAVLGGDLSQWAALAAWVLLAVLVQGRQYAALSPRRLSLLTVSVSVLFFLSFFLIAVAGGNTIHG